MRYPNYDLLNTERTAPVTGLVEIIAKRESSLAPNPIRKIGWSELLGSFCLNTAKGDKNTIRTALKDIKKLPNIPPFYSFIPRVQEFRNNTNQLKREQQDLHSKVILGLATILIKNPKDAYIVGNDKGRMTELTAQALLTRYAHPWLLTVPALPHHEADSNKAEHFDIALAVQESYEPSKHALQVKCSCIGRCNDANVRFRENYVPEIQIVSGCCDLGFNLENYEAPDFTVARNLVDEFYDNASTATIKGLDILTDNLLFNATSDLLARGTYVTEKAA